MRLNTRNILNNLIKNKDIVVIRPDKGRGVVILDKSDYVSKVNDVLQDETKFVRILDDPFQIMLRLKRRLNTFICSLRKKGKISEDDYKRLHISSAAPGKLYGLPKVHKTNFPVRPIMSAIGTYNRALAKFLVPLLQPLTTNPFTINSTQEFARTIRNLTYEGPIFLTSFDVTSLFTNIPVSETIISF